MHVRETQASRAVQETDALTCGRILVVDDDRPFGGFMVAALESRGHDADWAGCVADAVATLYTRRYDLLIIDLRLPDGSGLDLLRQASDEGLLVDSSAIILTGHDFEEPDDIRVFRKPLDIESFLDRTADIVLLTKRRRANGDGHAAAPARRGSHGNGHRSAKRQKIELVLYTSAASEKSARAIRAIQSVLEQYDQSQVSLTIWDLASHIERADEDSIVFTPTLVKRGPGPRTWIVGNLEQPELLVDLLEVSGVDRRRDGR